MPSAVSGKEDSEGGMLPSGRGDQGRLIVEKIRTSGKPGKEGKVMYNRAREGPRSILSVENSKGGEKSKSEKAAASV